MRFLFVSALVLSASVWAATESTWPDVVAPGRADRVFAKRQARDFGTFTPDCTNSAGACNNACYYIHCNAFNDPNANRVTYIGNGGNGGEADTNRLESGCNFNNPSPGSGSVCRAFPFSQKYASDPHDETWQCDEWPPASSRQPDFNTKQYKNSLRCMPGGENGSLGAQLRNFYQDQGGPYPGRLIAGPMSPGDFFAVDFSLNTNNSPFCNALAPGQFDCSNDGFQFGMTQKTVQNGKVDSPYNYAGNDNHYALQNTVYVDLFQCSIQFNRDGDTKINAVTLTNFNNIDTTAPDCDINNDGDVCTFAGLPNDVRVTRRGVFGQPFDFQYSDMSDPNISINYFAWNSEDTGPGRGPATDDGASNRWCRVTTNGNVETTECWFPCYPSADGQ